MFSGHCKGFNDTTGTLTLQGAKRHNIRGPKMNFSKTTNEKRMILIVDDQAIKHKPLTGRRTSVHQQRLEEIVGLEINEITPMQFKQI